jgi:UDP-N-acetylmuramyl pentapeptide phosphotransferase/UDP-N-acetylglucosamine-1-phosphate transferase
MFIFHNLAFLLLSAFGVGFIITYGVIPVIIHVAELKHLVDKPNERTSHTNSIPTLGGLGIFIGFILSATLFTDFKIFPSLQYFLFVMLIGFFLGMKDDVIALAPSKKFIGLLIGVSVLVILGDVRITSFYMLFGIAEIPYWVSIGFSIFTFLTIVNAVNLIDGINGLCTATSLISSLAFGIWFLLVGNEVSMQLAILIAGLIGALLAFLRYNITPAKIFMGDTGSLLLGVILAFLAIEFIEINSTYHGPYNIKTSPVVAMGFLALPLVDMLKVFMIRLYNRTSPFHPDKKHIHHLLLELGLNHTQATGLLSVLSVLFILLSLVLSQLRAQTFGMLILVIPLIVVCIPNVLLRSKYKKGKLKAKQV